MQITSDGIWSEPKEHGERQRILRRDAVELGT